MAKHCCELVWLARGGLEVKHSSEMASAGLVTKYFVTKIVWRHDKASVFCLTSSWMMFSH